MIFCKELNQSFQTKQELAKALYEHREDILAVKKSTSKVTDAIPYCLKSHVEKSAPGETLKVGDTIAVAMNTIGWLDSHNDVHISGCWTKSAREQSGKVFHVINHDLGLGSIIAYPRDVSTEVLVKSWAELGRSYTGSTEVLVFNSRITDKTNKDAYMAYRDGESLQHSIRMEYIGLKLCIDDPEMKEEYANWSTYYPLIVNKELADERGYFFAVTESKIVKEGSTVLFGSNEVTPTLSLSTQPEPPISTPKQPQEFDVMVAIKQTNFIH